MNVIQKVKLGYARLLDVPVKAFETPGFTFVETNRRESAEWAKWVLPVWLLSIGHAVVCSVAPRYSERAKTTFGLANDKALINPELLETAHMLIQVEGWRQREIFFYSSQQPPPVVTLYQVEKIKPGGEDDSFLKAFDGGVYAVRNEAGTIVSHAGIKNKGVLNEIAVGTEPEYRQMGVGTAVVAKAVTEILATGNVPIFVPDRLTNTASYRLARSLGFEKVGEMLFWEYELPGWEGFPVVN